MRLPRFRVRTLLIAVAVAALLVWGTMMGSRSYGYFKLARAYGTQEVGWRQIAGRGRSDAKFASECAEYFSRLTQKYRRATWHPWLPVEPDPHAPGFDLWQEQERRAKGVAPGPLGSPGALATPGHEI